VPSLVIVAGPNGSGKSTLIQKLRESAQVDLPDLYINADELQRAEGLDARQAQRRAEALRQAAIERRQSVLYETVMSHPSKIAELQEASRQGFTITVVFIATLAAELNVQRVRDRVAEGGHDVPRDRTLARYARTLALAPSAIGYANLALLFDNSQKSPVLHAELVEGRMRPCLSTLLPWTGKIVTSVNERWAELQGLLARRTWPAGDLIPARLDASRYEGPILRASSRHFALQLDAASGSTILHDRALLKAPVQEGQIYRLDYREGVPEASVARS
jgi:predicted ABC-type ATPase